MRPVLIDIPRLMYRRLTDKLPASVDRVRLACRGHLLTNAPVLPGLVPLGTLLLAMDTAAR